MASRPTRAQPCAATATATKRLGPPAAPFTTLNRLCRALNHSELKLDKMQALTTTIATIAKHIHAHKCSVYLHCKLLSRLVSRGRGGSLFRLTLFLAFAASVRRIAIDFLLLLCKRACRYMCVCV